MNLRRKLAAAAGGIAAVPLVLIALPASQAGAHGWITSPPSRQDMCATGRVADCGPIRYEPQSVEGPKGLRSCNAGLPQFAVLNDSWRFPATSVGSTVTFNWRLTAAHRTSTWEYYIGNQRIASFDQGGQQPPFAVSHTVGGLPGGRQTVLAIWNIADTVNAFYACVDLQVGGGSTNPVPTPTTTSPTPSPTASAPQPGGTWQAGTAYAVGAQVTYDARTYQCRQAHTALPGWEPPNVPALWRAV
jgi:predicted carbohydrate-binding protein with CBM5 and CBM33 domain